MAAGILTFLIGGVGSIFAFLISLFGVGMALDSLGPFQAMLILGAEIVIIYLAFAGGSAATNRRKWRLALAGAISAFLVAATLFYTFISSYPLSTYDSELQQVTMAVSLMVTEMVIASIVLLGAIASIILIIQSKDEFK